jgi:putative ABC transport system permease protein
MTRRSWLVAAIAGRAYGLALAACPRSFRERNGDAMRETFDALCRDAGARGHLAVIALSIREIADVLRASATARRHAGKPSALSQPGKPSALSPQPYLRRSNAVSALLQDIRYALRMLRRQPGFAIIAVLTLALGIGANTAVFTVVNGVLLRPLPYGDPDRLVVLLNGRAGRVSPWFSPLNYIDVTAQSNVFAETAAFNPITVNLTGHGDPQRVDGAEVTWPFFSVLNATPRMGRGFLESDAASGAPVIIVGDGFWRRELGKRPDAVGAKIQMDGTEYTVVGIAPADVALPRRAEFWRPLVFTADNLASRSRGAQWVSAVGRLKPGIGLEQANSAMAIVASRLAEQFPLNNKDRLMTATPLHEQIVRDVRPALLVLLGAVMLVLLIACVNVANLLLARAYGRAREVAVRAALGAGRRRLIQQFLAESLVLGIAGGAAGLLVAFWCTRALIALAPTTIPRLSDVGIDWRVLGFTVATAVATSVLFGLAPAVASTGGVMARFIIGAGRGSIGSPGTRTRKTLVVAEMALAVVLLVGAGLLVRSYERIVGVNPGFSPDRVLTFQLALPDAKYMVAESREQFISGFVNRLQQEGGVESASAIMGLPLDSDFSVSSSFRRSGEPDSADTPTAGMRIISPDYFKTLKIPLRAGRLFDAHDDATSPEVAIINEQAARRFWPGQNPVGREIRLGVRLVRGVRSGQKTIVGVIGDVKYGGLDAPTPPEVYLPHAQHPVGDLTIAVRTAGDPLAFVPTVRADLAAVDRELPLSDIRPMTDVVGRSVAERRFTMLLLASFALVAVMLAGIGIYGLLAYVVTQRTPEIGVRLAMGATPKDVVRLFVREGAALTIVGVVAGLAGALAAARALTTLLFGVTATDPATFVIVAGLLMAVALVASYVPARRAARVDPMTALRAD